MSDTETTTLTSLGTASTAGAAGAGAGAGAAGAGAVSVAATGLATPTAPVPTITGTTAWVFAGQGSQVPGMGRDIYEAWPQTRAIFESSAAGFNIKKTCFDSPAELLGDTRYTQACMAAFAAAVVLVLRENGLTCDATLGLSLGEYSALYAAGVFDAQTLLELLGFRGAIMADASKTPSRMSAVFGLADEAVEAVVNEVAARTGKVVSCTNYNCPGQVVIGGEASAAEEAETLLLKQGAKRCLPLKTSGPFHTALMAKAAQLLGQRLAATALKPQSIPVIFNAIAAPAADSDIRTLLVRQIGSPVRFSQSVSLLRESGITSVIEVGPGRVLAGLIKKTAPDISVVSIEGAEDLRKVIGI